MSHINFRDPDLQATEKIYRKIMSTGHDTSRHSDKSSRHGRTPRTNVGRKPHARQHSVTKANAPLQTTVYPHNKQISGIPLEVNEAALKRTHDGTSPESSGLPGQITETPQSYSSKKRAVANSTPVRSTCLLSRGSSDRFLSSVPVEKKVLDLVSDDLWNRSYQALRLEKELSHLSECRAMKRNSEIMKHRVDKMYMMSGSAIKLKPRYHVNEDDLQELKDLSRARAILRDDIKKHDQSRHNTSKSHDSRQWTNRQEDGQKCSAKVNGKNNKGGENVPHESVVKNETDWAGEAEHGHPHTPQDDVANSVSNPDTQKDESASKKGSDGQADDEASREQGENDDLNNNSEDAENENNPKDIDNVENGQETGKNEKDADDIKNIENIEELGENENDMQLNDVIDNKESAQDAEKERSSQRDGSSEVSGAVGADEDISSTNNIES